MKRKAITNLEVRRNLAKNALPLVRKLVEKFDLPSVHKAVTMIYDERKATKALRDAEAKVAALKKRLGA